MQIVPRSIYRMRSVKSGDIDGVFYGTAIDWFRWWVVVVSLGWLDSASFFGHIVHALLRLISHRAGP